MTRDNSQGPILPLVSETERLFNQRRRENQTNRLMYRGNEPGDGEQNQNAPAIPGAVARPRAIRDHLTLILDNLNPGIVAPEIQSAHLELKPLMFDMLNSIGEFGGAPHEDARQHIHAFLEFSDCFRQQCVHEDVLKFKLFPYSLYLCKRFFLHHNPPKMHTQLRNDIGYFCQANDESMFECWDRYKGLLHKCTNHGFHDWTKVIMFYNVVNAPTRMMLDASANGTLLDKSPEEAFSILDRIATNDYQFPTSRLGSERRTHGRLDLDANESTSAQLLAITNMLKNLQRPSEMKELKSANYMWNFNMGNHNPCSNSYDLGWSHHPNGSVSSSNINSLEATLQDFMATTKALLKDHDESIKSQEAILQRRGTLLQSHISSLKALETQVGQISQALHARPQGSLPTDTEITKAQGKEKYDSPSMKSKGKGLMSGPNSDLQNIATAKDNPQLVGVDEQRVTINVFNTLKYADDFSECQPLQDVESMMAKEEPVEVCCSNFSQIEDYLKLEEEENDEIKEYPWEVQHSSILIPRPCMQYELLDFAEFGFPKPFLEHPPTLELKLLSSYLEHADLGSNETFPIHLELQFSHLELNTILDKLITKLRSNLSQNRMSFRVFRTNYACLFDQEFARIIEESKEEQAQRRSKGIVIKEHN
ncbi:hypothetical protein GQ457_04G021590 [Hibiscus cannabinus]